MASFSSCLFYLRKFMFLAFGLNPVTFHSKDLDQINPWCVAYSALVMATCIVYVIKSVIDCIEYLGGYPTVMVTILASRSLLTTTTVVVIVGVNILQNIKGGFRDLARQLRKFDETSFFIQFHEENCYSGLLQAYFLCVFVMEIYNTRSAWVVVFKGITRMYILLAIDMHLSKVAQVKRRYKWLNRTAEDVLCWTNKPFRSDFHSFYSSNTPPGRT